MFKTIPSQTPWLVTAALLVVLLAGPPPLPASPIKTRHTQTREVQAQQKWRISQASAIQEAVFRYEIQEDKRERPQSVEPYFLNIRGRDPDEALMKRFSGHTPLVEGRSAWSGTYGTEVLLSVGNISWMTNHTVEVNGTRFYDILCAYDGIYHVSYAWGRWAVSKYAPTSIAGASSPARPAG